MERTLCIIKPDAFLGNHVGDILHIIEREGFQILGLRAMQLTKEQAQKFYEVHHERSFYISLVTYMTSAPVVAIALGRENAVNHWRKVIGATDPSKAEPGTIRKLFAKSIEANAVHGSDSVENGKIETDFFFRDNYLPH